MMKALGGIPVAMSYGDVYTLSLIHIFPAGYGLDKLSLDMGAAECTVLGVTTSKLEIDTGVGAITFSGTVNGDVEVETGVGDVTLNLTGSQDGYKYQVECGVGKMCIRDRVWA